VRTRLTFDAADDDSPVWSPDGRRIAFRSSRGSRRDLYEQASNGSGSATELFLDASNKTPLSWSPNGKYLLFAGEGGGGRLWVLPLTGRRNPVPLHETRFRESEGQFSPDGGWVAYVSNESGRDEVYVTPFPGQSMRSQISTAGGRQPRWRRDGRELFYLAPDSRLMAVAVTIRGSKVEAGAPEPLFTVLSTGPGAAYAVSPDGQQFLVAAADASPAPALNVVVNWPGALKR
jgi:Tol biopolymer transport system component